MKDKLKQLLDNCTTGLIGDTELRLDVQAELKNHIEERIAEEQENGADKEKSLETALKAFGEAPEIADSIVSANKKRMNLRAKIRIAAMYLIVPFSISGALFSLDFDIFYPTDIFPQFDRGTPLQSKGLNQLLKDTFGIFRPEKYTNDEKLILYGAANEKDRVKKQKAICDRFPENKIYMGNYISSLLGIRGAGPIDSEKGQEFIRELRNAEKLEPENGRKILKGTGFIKPSHHSMERKT